MKAGWLTPRRFVTDELVNKRLPRRRAHKSRSDRRKEEEEKERERRRVKKWRVFVRCSTRRYALPAGPFGCCLRELRGSEERVERRLTGPSLRHIWEVGPERIPCRLDPKTCQHSQNFRGFSLRKS